MNLFQLYADKTFGVTHSPLGVNSVTEPARASARIFSSLQT